MKDTLTLTLLQTQLHWENKNENLKHLGNKILALNNPGEIIILPEMFNTGFTMNAEAFSENMGEETMQWMFNLAHQTQAVICGSIIIKEQEHFFNRFIWMTPNGQVEYYNKRHLFRMGNEHEYYTPGEAKNIIQYKGWKILPLVCYDLRFPVWSRNQLPANGYDLLIYVANWPERRRQAWSQLLIARAIENQCFVAGVNRVGRDGKDINHTGDSALVNYLGDSLLSFTPETEEIKSYTLTKTELEQYRTAFPAYLDADDFEVNN